MDGVIRAARQNWDARREMTKTAIERLHNRYIHTKLTRMRSQKI
jgi:hypothetical protein